MMRLTKFYVVSVLCMLFSTAVQADEKAVTMTLADVVQKGIYTNPDYGIAANQGESAKEDLVQAKSFYLPSIDFLAETGIDKTSSPALARSQKLRYSRGNLTLTQLLFDGWGTQSEVSRQKYRLESASKRVEAVTEALGLDIVQAYLEVLRQRGLLSVSRANVDKHTTLLGKIKAGAKAGTMTQGDVAQAQSRVNSARAAASTIEQGLRSAEALFIQKVGEMPGEMALPENPYDKLPATVEEAVQQALKTSQTMAIFESDIKAAEAAHKGTKSVFSPRFELKAVGSDSINQNGLEGNQNSAQALAVMRWSLYRGGADMARVRQSRYQQAEAEGRREQAARQLEKDIRDSWAGMRSAQERTKEFLQQVKANKKVVRVYLDQFSLHHRTLLDVLDAQNELFISRLDHVNAIYTEKFSIYRILALEGKLLSVLGVKVKPFREAKLEGR